MPWKRTLAYITGSVSEDLLRRIEYLLEENRVLRKQIDKRLRLTDPERRTLAGKAVALGKLMADTVTIVKPETILKWHWRLVARKFDGSRCRKQQGRPPTKAELEELVVRFARDNPAWVWTNPEPWGNIKHNLGPTFPWLEKSGQVRLRKNTLSGPEITTGHSRKVTS